MKADEAKKVLKGTLSLMYQTRIMFDDVTAYRNAMKVAIEALEKQVPKKPVIVVNDGVTYKNCQNCSSLVGIEAKCLCLHYCHICSQAIDWSEVK